MNRHLCGTAVAVACLALPLSAQDHERSAVLQVTAVTGGLRLDLRHPGAGAFFGAVLVSDTGTLSRSEQPFPPVLLDAEVVATGHGTDGALSGLLPVVDEIHGSLFFQGVTIDQDLEVAATAVVEVRNPCGAAGPTGGQDDDEEGGDEDRDPALLVEPLLEGLRLTVLGTDSVPPEFTLTAVLDAPGAGYEMAFEPLQDRDPTLVLVVKVPDETVDDDTPTRVHTAIHLGPTTRSLVTVSLELVGEDGLVLVPATPVREVRLD